jgi:uncharacterized membrane protein
VRKHDDDASTVRRPRAVGGKTHDVQTDVNSPDADVLERYERAHDPSRVLLLSDGVCAIILTLLVLEVHVPETLREGESLFTSLRALRPSLVAFGISFVVVAIAWAGHRDLFAVVRRTDRALVWLNFLYLLPLCLLPFAASLLARYPSNSDALRIYGLLLVAVAVTRICIWLYATGQPRLLVGTPDRQFRRVGVAVAAGPGLAYLVAIAIAAVAPLGSMLIYAAVPVGYFLAITFTRSTTPEGSSESDLT